MKAELVLSKGRYQRYQTNVIELLASKANCTLKYF